MRRFLPAAASLVSFALYAADPPAMKEGLWTIHTTSIDNPGNKKTEGTRSICRNHAYDARVREQGEKQQKETCKIANQNYSGNKFTSDSECTVQGTVIKSKGTVTFSGDTAFVSETHATYTPALFGNAETTLLIDQKYVGPCPAGMQPGDSMSADGKITHIKRP